MKKILNKYLINEANNIFNLYINLHKIKIIYIFGEKL